MATAPFYPFLRRVRIENYRSIAHCDVELQPLTFLVGPNGSGKSNFLQAIRLVSDAMRGALDDAISAQGSFQELVQFQSHKDWFTVELNLSLSDRTTADYTVTVGPNQQGGPWVSEEKCIVRSNTTEPKRYLVGDGKLYENNLPVTPPPSADRLYLPIVAGLPEFTPVFDALSGMRLYQIVPEQMRGLREYSSFMPLAPNGGNVASVLLLMQKMLPSSKRRIEEYLAAVLPGVMEVSWKKIENRLLLQILSEPDSGLPSAMSPWQLSDGTLRALGVLVALFQHRDSGQKMSVIGLEEPETAIHPGAARVLLDAMLEAALTKQVLVTTHSPDLLDSTEVSHESILAVALEQAGTTIRPIDEEGRRIMRERLITPGEFLRIGQLHSVAYEDDQQ